MCVAANKIVIMQAANTGLTGGSTPADDDYDRDVIIINALKINKLHIIEQGRQVICLPGVTLYQLEEALKPFGRDPHSVIGSSCIGASVIGGICNNSGGSLVRRGPAYTQMALFAQVDERGRLNLVNHIGVRLGNEPERLLERLERGDFEATDIEHDPNLKGADYAYAQRVREIDSDRPARFNADPNRLFEASGSAGRLIVFAVRVDTFPRDSGTRVFYIGTNDSTELTALRRHVLGKFQSLPVAGEYIHRNAFDIAEVYGKDTFLAIHYLGTPQLPRLFRFKARLDALSHRIGFRSAAVSDKLLQGLGRLFPSHLPTRIKQYRDRFEHHLIVKMEGDGIEEAAAYFASIFPSQKGDFFECRDDEGKKALLHRFAVAGAAVRYRALYPAEVADIVALDVALRQNDPQWVEVLPEEMGEQIIHKLYYGHFFCHVFHQDYIVRKGCDVAALEHLICQLLDERAAEYPAEHNVGHLYRAKPALSEFYHRLDPGNHFNPGIGQTSKVLNWGQ
jgi:D-lactate dehydrogenase